MIGEIRGKLQDILLQIVRNLSQVKIGMQNLNGSYYRDNSSLNELADHIGLARWHNS